MMQTMMARRCSRLVHVIAIAIATIFVSAGNVLAKEETETTIDARLEGYGKELALEGSTATMWMLLIVLAIVTLCVLFKDAKRSHLD
jgi:hypothetical protein